MILQLFLRLARWLLRKVGAITVLSLSLLLLIMGSLSWGLADVARSLNPRALLWVATFALLVGWGLGRAKTSFWIAVPSLLLIGGLGLLLYFGELGNPLLHLFGKLTSFLWQALWRVWGDWPDNAPLAGAFAEVSSGLGLYGTRLLRWLTALLGNRAAFDPLSAAFVWGMAVWLSAAWSGWELRRRNQPLLAVLPAGALLAFSLNYSRGNSLYLGGWLGGTLLLTAAHRHLRDLHRWHNERIDYAEDLPHDLTLAIIALTVLLTLAAMFAPMVSIRKISEFVRQLRQGDGSAGESLGLKGVPGTISPFNIYRSPGLPRQHLLGAGQELSQQIVLFARLEDYPLTSPPYWRSLTYDIYTGQGWYASDTETHPYKAGDIVTQIEYAAQREVKQRIQIAQAPSPISRQPVEGLVYAVGELVTVNQKFHLARRSAEDIFGGLISRNYRSAAPFYEATSLVTTAEESQLRTAGEEYPEWVRQRYLALPVSVTERVRQLALDLTLSLPTPYERARAIESYLRRFPYTLDIPAPPADRDVSDYFLFDLRQGYCDYYATAMAVLARAAGLPARLVVGYAAGSYDQATDRYVVTEADAHSWVEIYFPTVGWVEFEPTGARPSIEYSRPARIVSPSFPEEQQPLAPAAPGFFSLPQHIDWLSALIALPVLLLSALMIALWADQRSLSRFSPAQAVIRIFRRLYLHARRLKLPLEAGDTPAEFSVALIAWLEGIFKGRVAKRLFSPIPGIMQRLTDLYLRAVFSPHPLIQTDQLQSIRGWRILRWRLWLARLF